MSWFFDTTSPFDKVVEKVTAEHQTSENWEHILLICDAITNDSKLIKPVITSIKKRLNHRDPHVVILAISLLDSCWANCGPTFRREISSREFICELEAKCRSSVRQIGEKARLMIKKWVESEAKDDDSLSLVRTLYKTLSYEGLSFEPSEPKKRVVISDDPNVVTSQEEEDAIAKAIAASLNDAKENAAKTSGGSSLYPTSMNGGSHARASPLGSHVKARRATFESSPPASRAYPSLSMASTIIPRTVGPGSPRHRRGGEAVDAHAWPTAIAESDETLLEERNIIGAAKHAFALYDFEAAEDNELSFKTGDEVVITDDSNANWWRGRNERTRAEGLFPTSFVTMNRAEVMQQAEPVAEQGAPAPAVVRIDEEQLMKCIALLEDCDPTGAVSDPPELPQIEASSLAQAPLIDAALASVDRQSNALAMVDVSIRNVLALYDSAVQQANYARYAAPPPMPMQHKQPPPLQLQQQHVQQPAMPSAQHLQQHPQAQYYMQQQAAVMQQPPQQQPMQQQYSQQIHPQQPLDWQQQQYLQHMQQQHAQYSTGPAAAVPYPQQQY